MPIPLISATAMTATDACARHLGSGRVGYGHSYRQQYRKAPDTAGRMDCPDHMVRLELSTWLLRVAPEEMADWIPGIADTCQIVPLDNSLANLVAESCINHKLATAEAVIYATVRANNAEVGAVASVLSSLPRKPCGAGQRRRI